MQCAHPINVRNRLVPCGKCYACLANRQRQWTFRLESEKDDCSFFFWLTLTYADEHLPIVDGRPAVSKKDCRFFFEKMRKKFPGVTFKHFLVSEYGPQTVRPHYHTLLFVNTVETNFERISVLKSEIQSFFQSAWPFGFAYEKDFHNHVFGYVTKYCCKPDLIGQDVPVPVFTLISQGIGKNFLQRMDFSEMVENYDFLVSFNGKRMQLPRYYQDKLIPHSETHAYRTGDSQELANYKRIKGILLNRECQFERTMVREIKSYDAKHGDGAFNRRERAKIDYKTNDFIKKLKERKNG